MLPRSVRLGDFVVGAERRACFLWIAPLRGDARTGSALHVSSTRMGRSLRTLQTCSKGRASGSFRWPRPNYSILWSSRFARPQCFAERGSPSRQVGRTLGHDGKAAGLGLETTLLVMAAAYLARFERAWPVRLHRVEGKLAICPSRVPKFRARHMARAMRSMRPMRILYFLALAPLVACGSSPQERADAGGDQQTPEPDASSIQYCDKMDIVFVIDNSDTMKEEQENLIENFPRFVEVLDNFDTLGARALDYRIAVTTTSRAFEWVLDLTPIVPIPTEEMEQGDSGRFRQQCGMSQPWISSSDQSPVDTFSCVANVGVGGSRFEMPLYNLELAFTRRLQDGNSGFLRDDALLAVVILTDEDDCSRSDDNFTLTDIDQMCAPDDLVDPSSTIDKLDELKGHRDRWAAAVIAGPGPGTCMSDFGEAEEASRLKDFVSQAGQNAVFSSICQDDLASALDEALATFTAACEELDPIN